MILVLANQEEIIAKSPGRERWNLIWTFGHQFLGSTVNIRLKYSLSRPGETCGCSNDLLRIFSTVDFCTRENSWEMRETPFGETGFWAVAPWLVVQVTQTMVPGVGFWCFRSKRARFARFFVSRFHGVFTPKTGFSSQKRPRCLPYGRGRSLPYGREFGAGDTTLGRPRRTDTFKTFDVEMGFFKGPLWL